MLIVEGPDLVGKTTFCRALVRRADERGLFPAIYHHLSRLPSTWDPERDYLPLVSPFVVQDRFHLSEIVYGHVTRGESFLAPGTASFIDETNARQGGMTLIFCAPDPAFIVEQHQKRGDQMFPLEKILEVNEMYCRLIDTRETPYLCKPPGGTREVVRYSLDDSPSALSRGVAVLPGPGPFPAESPLVDVVLDAWTARLQAAGFAPRR